MGSATEVEKEAQEKMKIISFTKIAERVVKMNAYNNMAVMVSSSQCTLTKEEKEIKRRVVIIQLQLQKKK